MITPRPGTPRSAKGGQVRIVRRRSGEFTTGDFLRGVLEGVRVRLPDELRGLQSRHQGWLIQFFAEDPAIHFELWPHRARGRVEFGLHFEMSDADCNRRLLEYVADELLFLKHALGNGLEAEPWDKGWTRLYISHPLEHLGSDDQARIVAAFAEFIETLEPIRYEAVQACVVRQ